MSTELFDCSSCLHKVQICDYAKHFYFHKTIWGCICAAMMVHKRNIYIKMVNKQSLGRQMTRWKD